MDGKAEKTTLLTEFACGPGIKNYTFFWGYFLNILFIFCRFSLLPCVCVSGIKWIGWVFSLALVIFHAGFAARHPDGNTPLCPCWTQHLPPVLRLTPLAACGILFVNLFSFCVENKVFVVYFLFWRFFFAQKLLQRALPEYFKHVREVTHTHTHTHMSFAISMPLLRKHFKSKFSQRPCRICFAFRLTFYHFHVFPFQFFANALPSLGGIVESGNRCDLCANAGKWNLNLFRITCVPLTYVHVGVRGCAWVRMYLVFM